MHTSSDSQWELVSDRTFWELITSLGLVQTLFQGCIVRLCNMHPDYVDDSCSYIRAYIN